MSFIICKERLVLSMNISSGITKKGTIFIRQFDDAGHLLRKRVLNRHQQYDTCFVNKNNERHWGQILHTNWVNDSQTLLCTPIKLNWFHKLFVRPPKELITTNSKGQKYLCTPPIDMDLLLAQPKGKFRVGFLQGLTGFADETVNALCKELKDSYLKKVFG